MNYFYRRRNTLENLPIFLPSWTIKLLPYFCPCFLRSPISSSCSSAVLLPIEVLALEVMYAWQCCSIFLQQRNSTSGLSKAGPSIYRNLVSMYTLCCSIALLDYQLWSPSGTSHLASELLTWLTSSIHDMRDYYHFRWTPLSTMQNICYQHQSTGVKKPLDTTARNKTLGC